MMNTRTLAIIGVGIGLLLLLRRNGTASQGQSGSITGMSIDGVRMGTHLTPKSPGQQTDISVNWMGATKNAAGSGITWFYRVNVVLINANNPSQILLSATGPSTVGEYGVGKNTTHRVNLPTSLAPGMFITAVARLEALTSDANGNPTATWVRLADVEHTNAIQIVGSAQPAGSIGAVNVSQQSNVYPHEQIRSLFNRALDRR